MESAKVNDSGFTIGNGYFANLHPLRHHSERICFVTSVVSNTVLIVLLVREKNETMKPYSRVLLINVIFDFFYTVMCMAVEMELEMNEGVYIFVINGLPKDLSPTVQKLAIGVWIFGCASACMVSPIEFIFRYFLVVKSYTLSFWQLLFCAGIVALNALIDALFLYLAMNSVEDHGAAFGRLMENPMWDSDGAKAVYYGANKSNVFLLLFVCVVTIQDVAIFGFIAVSTVATLATLRQNRHRMSSRARYMQSQINRLMFAEVFSLASVAVIRMACVVTLLFLKIKFVGFGVLRALLLQWILGVNPVTTIFLVGPYRRQLFGRCYQRSWAVDAANTSAHSFTQRASRSCNSNAEQRSGNRTTVSVVAGSGQVLELSQI